MPGKKTGKTYKRLTRFLLINSLLINSLPSNKMPAHQKRAAF
tara:strand:- start:244 stop:369 length:126 start_codon:yes stop_codon:yes gene_type:complete